MEAKTLALYLGCECTEAGLSSRGNTLVEVAFDGYETSSVRTPQGSILNIKTTRIKPILRPLSSMTYKECSELGWFYILDDKKIEHKAENLIPLEFQYLLSKGFDLFGLIEKGEALNLYEYEKTDTK